ncbi:MAG TPA: ATP-binding protein [Myxococcota bacterium]|jgi:PAS domain S-box-containing protein
MQHYVLIPLISCIVTAMLASAILTRNHRDPRNRLAALVVSGASFWALCEVVWNTSSDEATVLWLVRASTLGWVFIGPLVLHLFLGLTGAAARRTRRALPVLYATGAMLLLLDWMTPWMHPSVERTSWGWAFSLGPAYPVFIAFTLTSVGLAIGFAFSGYRRLASPGERAQAIWVMIGLSAPLSIATMTDGVLPYLGVQVPRLGTATFVVLGGTISWSFFRYGYSLLAPGDFAREILETLPDGVAMLRLDGSVRSANEALARLLECRPDELTGLRLTNHLEPPAALFEPAAPADRQCELRTFGGRRTPVAVASTLLRDRQGSALGHVVVMRDLAEINSLRHGLLLSGRLAAVGELAAGIAHEINNPLAFAKANLALLREHWEVFVDSVRKPGDRAHATALLAEGEELIDESLEGVERAAAIVRDVRGLAHAGSRRRELTDLNQLLDGVLRMAAPQLRKHATVYKEWGVLPPITCVPQEIQQVFLNVVLNAGQAIAVAGTIKLVSRVEGAQVVVDVEDDGGGIPPEIKSRIFDPFFTTKPVGEGTGLGLSIAYGIVRKHGGEITVASEAGRGTRFSVRLPADADTMPG